MIIKTQNAPAAIGPYSQGVVAVICFLFPVAALSVKKMDQS